MARPFSASDEEILQAARQVLARRGPDAFSIAEVASEVGLSRAAIILRFTSTQALKRTSLAQLVEQFIARLQALPKSPGGDNLLQIAAFIGSHIGSREGGARYFVQLSSNLHDRDLLELERRRGDALSKTISAAMPKTAVAHESAVTAFRAHLAGSVMAWLALDEPDSRRYLLMRTREWLKLAGIAFSEALAEALAAPPSESPGKQVASRTTRSKTARRVERAQPRR